MKKNKVAIIGSGISGLSTALFLSKKFDVHLFEKNEELGGHTRTRYIKDDNIVRAIDTGFIVFNDRNYPDLKNFFEYLNVKTHNSDMSFSFSSISNNIEYGGSNFFTLFAQPKNLFSLSFLQLLRDIYLFYKQCNSLNNDELLNKFTIEEFLDYKQYDYKIKNFHIYPMISSIWSANKKDVKKFPLILFIRFFKNHGLFSFVDRPQWKFVEGGSINYIKNLIKKNLFNYYTNSKITKVDRTNDSIIIFLKDKKIKFDKVVFANHADQALQLISNPSLKEKSILSKFKYTKNKAYLHSDNMAMPSRKRVWSSWNFIEYHEKQNFFSLTYWMNKLQKIDSKKNYFVSINPGFIPEKVYDTATFDHPIFNFQTLKAQNEISEIQGLNNTFFCGSYCGYGFHEDGIQSAAYISNLLNIDLPWKRDINFKNRLKY